MRKLLNFLLGRFGFVTTYGSRSIEFTSVKLFLKRNLAGILGYRASRKISIRRLEKPAFGGLISLGEYSEASVCELIDPRNSSKIGHYFNPRYSFMLQEVLVEPFHGLVFTLNGDLIDESTNMNANELYQSFPLNLKHRNNLKIDSCIVLPSTSYWHWLYEDLPLFLRAHAANPHLPVLVSNRRPKYVDDLIQFLGVEVIKSAEVVRVSRLVFFSKDKDYGWPHPSDINVLKYSELLSSIQGKGGPKKVFVERGLDRRTPVNEGELALEFEKHGFTTVNAKELNFIDEISLFRQVEILVGIHGAGQGNMVWSQVQNMTLIDIVQDNYWTESGFKAASVMNHRYASILYKESKNKKISVKKVLEDALTMI